MSELIDGTQQEKTPRNAQTAEIFDLRVEWIESSPERAVYGAPSSTEPGGPSEFRGDTIVSGGKWNNQGSRGFGLDNPDILWNLLSAKISSAWKRWALTSGRC